ncbi:MAG: hypothetical protein DIZ80_12710 [endosymbiont of Galathealinum brachiosum]|uniref:Hydrazine synthase alpha subunit middle domain-containing protein n=1 Tax=endosymbiont of Galathealinum brachiosum TaxID=2200906 RepID=A0A370DE03_9GAMM|nr:MAG: hypothetical protein DIZ80_12710 [endosymbiont of Galathealinum brachiosum]
MRNNFLKFVSTSYENWLSQFFLLLFAVAGTVLLTSCGGSETGADPGIEDFPIAYVKRAILVDDDGIIIQPDIREPLESTPGGDIFLKSGATISSPAVNITAAITNGNGDVKDLDVSSDGKILVFSLLTEDPDPNDNTDNPKWDIYTYNRETNELNRVIISDIIAEEGDDVAPYFLPNNNKIVFSSNRQKKSRAILLDEDLSKPQFSSLDEDSRSKALVLHVMDIDGTNIEQISFNQSHDLDPVVLSNGRILFSRWDNANTNNAISLYTILQDGSDLQPYYGTHDESHDIPNVDNNNLQFIQPRELPDGRIMALQIPFTDTFAGGEIITIDGENFIDINQPTTANQGGAITSAVEKVTNTSLTFDDTIAFDGRYSSFYPLNDGTSRILVSKGLCQIEVDMGTDPMVPELETFLCVDTDAEPFITDGTAVETYPSYGIWLFDGSSQTEKPIEVGEVGMFLNDAVVMRPYNRATVNLGKPEAELDTTLISEKVGLLYIRSVYDFGDSNFNGCFLNVCTDATVTDVLSLGDPAIATADQRPARFIRLVKAVGLPDRRDPDLANPPNLSARAFGRGGRTFGMKEIIGYSPIQPDGSVLVKVPANIAFYFEILDKDARRIGSRHENWLQVNAGDTSTCSGCHVHTNGVLPLPHGRLDAEAASINTGAPSDGYIYPNTQNPVTMSDYLVNFGDTMAEALSRAQPESSNPSINIEFIDVWTDPTIPALTPDATFNITYSGVPTAELSSLTTPAPNTAPCETQWNAACRTVINYQEHIQPIWDVDRSDINGINPDNTCTNCHATVDSVGVVMVPAGQLDLTATDPSDEEVQHIESYRELFFNDNFQDISGNILIDVLITQLAFDDDGNPVLDANGVQLTEQVPDPGRELSPSMNANGARVSYFIEKMTQTELNAGRALPSLSDAGVVNHANMLTPAELRLISEYLDIGGQYFNNPFDPLAPQN